jgi:hypothetical protein
MTNPISIADVSSILEEPRFKKIEMPFSLAGISFSFPGAFLGQPPSNDLILIIDTDQEAESRLNRRVQGLTRALDLIGSRKPLTAVILGERSTGEFVESLSYLCRVLPLNKAPTQEALNRLAILLPLELPQANGLVIEPLNELLLELEDFDGPLKALAQQAKNGSGFVREHLIHLINSKLIDEEGADE